MQRHDAMAGPAENCRPTGFRSLCSNSRHWPRNCDGSAWPPSDGQLFLKCKSARRYPPPAGAGRGKRHARNRPPRGVGHITPRKRRIVPCARQSASTRAPPPTPHARDRAGAVRHHAAAHNSSPPQIRPARRNRAVCAPPPVPATSHPPARPSRPRKRFQNIVPAIRESSRGRARPDRRA